MRSRRVFAGRLPGERRSKRRGSSIEFDDHRPYVPGDDLRRIDWNAFARTDRLVLKLFREDEDMALRVIVDASPSMLAGTPTKLETAHRLGMALASLGLLAHNRVSVSAIGLPPGGPASPAPRRGRTGVRAVGEHLLATLAHAAEPSGTPEESFNDALRRLAADRLAGSGVVVLLSDFLVREGVARGLDALAAARGFDTWLVHVLAPEELDPTAAVADGRFAGDMRLEDAEGGRAAEITLSDALLRRYRQRLAAFRDELDAAATARGMRLILVRSDADVGELILRTLRRRGLVG